MGLYFEKHWAELKPLFERSPGSVSKPILTSIGNRHVYGEGPDADDDEPDYAIEDYGADYGSDEKDDDDDDNDNYYQDYDMLDDLDDLIRPEKAKDKDDRDDNSEDDSIPL